MIGIKKSFVPREKWFKNKDPYFEYDFVKEM